MRQLPDRSTTIAAALGFCALLLNLASTPFSFEIGAIALFIAAIGFGIEGAAIASLIGALSLGLLTQEYLIAFKLTAGALVVGWWSQAGMRRSPLLPLTLLWLTGIVAIAALSTSWSPLPNELRSSAAEFLRSWGAISNFIGDLLALTFAAVLLTTDFGWYTVVGRSRVPSLSNAIVHFISLSALLSIALAIGIMRAHGPGATTLPTTLWVLPLAAGIVPTLVIVALRHLFPFALVQDRRGALSLGPDRDQGFSGNSSTFLRRRELVASASRSDSENHISRSDIAAQGSGYGPEYGVCVLDSTGVVTVCNRKFSKLAGGAVRDAIGKRFETIVLAPEISKCFIELITNRSPFKRTREVRVASRENKSGRFFELSALPAELATGALQGEPGTIVLSIREVTDRRAIEEHLLRAQKLASLGSVATSISHAFNNALTAIIGRASHARLVNQAHQMSSALEDIITESKRAGALVKRLIDFASDGSGANESVNVGQLLSDNRDLFKSIVGPENGFEILIPDRPFAVRCDPSLLTQVLTNLLLNARDALEGRTGKVSISLDGEDIDSTAAVLNAAARPGQFVRIRVSDNGRGMGPGVLEHACEPSFTTRANRGRAGLGLTTAFAIARAHDGFLSIESTPEVGTTISVYLPRIPHRAHGTPDLSDNLGITPLSEANKPLSDTRILVLEDEPIIRELLVEMLASLGAKAVSFDKPEEALSGAAHQKFDLALVDLVMPHMRGDEWLRALRKATLSNCSSIPVVLMTGHGTEPSQRTDFQAVLPKPFTMEDLLRVVAQTKGAQASPAPNRAAMPGGVHE